MVTPTTPYSDWSDNKEGLILRWLTSLKFSEVKLKFMQETNTHDITK
jgi:hypothetical protein